MTTFDLLDEAIAAAERLGCRVTEDWLDGRCGGLCVLRGERLLVLDLALTTDERLEEVLAALRELGAEQQEGLSPELRERLAA